MHLRRVLGSAAVAAAVLVPLAVSAPPAQGFAVPAGSASLVRVHTPTDAARDLLTTLGLDLGEHAGADFVDVVLHDSSQAGVLQAAGLTFDVVVADLVASERERVAADRAFAVENPVTALPSGRNSYRTLDDYNAEMQALAAEHPDLVRVIELAEPSVEGRTVYGIEVARDPGARLDRPVMVMLGVHHAREWPSGENAMEFAYDLVRGYGSDPRITNLVDRVRVLVVPVVNVDGFVASRTDGELLDLRELGTPENDPTGLGQTGVVLLNPGNAYKRKNCRLVDGVPTPAGACAVPGARYLGVDLNRNYGSLWGGNGAGALPTDETYRGPAPFSEPESRNIRDLVASNNVTMLITNHTFGNLILRPPGVRDYGFNLDDEAAMTHIGARMAAQNGYANQHGWELYDTTGTTEDWSYLATGGFGYTFEIGGDEFHPPFADVVGQYLGTGEFTGSGNREAYLIALEAAANGRYHARLTGQAPAGAVLRLSRAQSTETSPVQLLPTQFTDDPGIGTGEPISFPDDVSTSMVVPGYGRYLWHVNPSTRPAVASRTLPPGDGEIVRTETASGGGGDPAPGGHTDVPFSVSGAEAGHQLVANLDWPLPDDYDLELLRVGAGGALEPVASSGEAPGSKEEIVVDAVDPGDYVFRVVNYAAVSPWTLTMTTRAPGESPVVEGATEAWTMTCERDGVVRQTVEVEIARGQLRMVNFRDC
jgi:hypothetical protein